VNYYEVANVSELADRIRAYMKDHDLTLREVEELAGISRSSVSDILNNPNRVPKLDTFMRVADLLGLPLYRVIEMAGFNLGLSETPADVARRLAVLMERSPEYRPLAVMLTQLQSDDLEGVLAYLEMVLLRRSRRDDQSTGQSRA
jgi:transcriptional regulator with XRE-family HTH domain